MRKMIFAAAFVAVGILNARANEATVLTTTQADVKKQCGGHTECTTGCGGTLCN